jgi:hypothetical protein
MIMMWRFARVRLSTSRHLCAVVFLLMMTILGRAHAGPLSEEAREFFVRFVDAQNAHDIDAVRSMIWESPDFLWISRGVPIRGSNKALETYGKYFKATWQLKPDLGSFEAAELPGGSVRIVVKVEFIRGEPGQPPQRSDFLISQILVRDAGGFRISTILPVADTRLK